MCCSTVATPTLPLQIVWLGTQKDSPRIQKHVFVPWNSATDHLFWGFDESMFWENSHLLVVQDVSTGIISPETERCYWSACEEDEHGRDDCCDIKAGDIEE